jgi:hypothetical protein
MKSQLQIPMINFMHSILVSVFAGFIFIGCGSTHKLPPDMPKDFGFILQYGEGGKNILNTFDQTYTKDLIMNGTITTKLAFTEAELKMMHDTMASIKIMTFPESMQRNIVWHEMRNSDSTIEQWSDPVPMSSNNYFVKLKVRMNDKEHEVIYRPDNCEDPVRCRDFDFLIRLIEENLERKKEYRDLPKAEGGYL